MKKALYILLYICNGYSANLQWFTTHPSAKTLPIQVLLVALSLLWSWCSFTLLRTGRCSLLIHYVYY